MRVTMLLLGLSQLGRIHRPEGICAITFGRSGGGSSNHSSSDRGRLVVAADRDNQTNERKNINTAWVFSIDGTAAH